MTEAYDYFMLFELDDSGEKIRINAGEEEFRANNGLDFLHPEQVLVIVKEPIRRIYIWKGAKSPVRKRFISSRVASKLQEELVKEAAFHRCKIVSVDQGDEVIEFLNAFNFESMPVEEKLADMRYIRNVDREKMYDQGIVPEEGPQFVKVDKKPKEHVSPALQKLDETRKKEPVVSSSKPAPQTVSPARKTPYHPSSARSIPARQVSTLSEDQKKSIMNKILENNVPKGYKRQNLILGHTLYGAVLKKVNILGKDMEETEWEEVTSVPKNNIEIDNRKLRVYFDEKKGIVEALEVLEKIDGISDDEVKKETAKPESEDEEDDELDSDTKASINFNYFTVKELKSFADDHDIDLPSRARKAEIIDIIEEAVESENEEDEPPKSTRRKLPEIPKE
ncbi:MAG: hypothetical protein EU542_04170 [Promethearchaeota archaeon]|nr:MAG: hypothetical protein EU542_04170 [Candidatus Lokiarchaeota archaeon]